VRKSVFLVGDELLPVRERAVPMREKRFPQKKRAVPVGERLFSVRESVLPVGERLLSGWSGGQQAGHSLNTYFWTR
jgi:hypothetical protein